MTNHAPRTQTIVLGGGCFWCLDAAFREIAGVTAVTSGYAGGHTKHPNYWLVASKLTGHAEVVKVEFDPKIITLPDILDIFWTIHDPTTPNRQGHDIGPEYRSLILYDDEDQRQAAEKSRDQVQKLWPNPVVTEIKPLDIFYEAEPEHQDYYAKNPEKAYCSIVINPKLHKLREKFAARLKPSA